jgi:hypothetical protein
MKLGTGHRLGTAPIPAAHLPNLIGRRCIEMVEGHYRATAMGIGRENRSTQSLHAPRAHRSVYLRINTADDIGNCFCAYEVVFSNLNTEFYF